MYRSLLTYVAVLALVLTAQVVAVAQPGGPGGPTPVVVESVIQRDDLPEDRTFVGTVHASQTSVVGSAVDGRVERVPVEDGDWVTEGQLLTELRTKTIGLEIAAAKAELELRQYELQELTEGSRPDEKAQAQAALERSRAMFGYADSRLKRTLDLPETALSQEELEQDQSSRDVAEQAWLEAQANWNLVVEGPREEKKLQAAARVKMQQAEIDRLEDLASKYTIMAPFDGYIVAKHAEVGQWLSRADPVVEMVAVDPIEVHVSIPEDYIAALKLGARATVRLNALPDPPFEPFNATIARIVPQADLRSRSFPVRFELENPRSEDGHVIKAGMLAHVAFVADERDSRVLVHKDALVLSGQTAVVWLITVDQTTKATIAVPVPVELGATHGSYYHVSGDLKVGQDVVVEGNERLRPGAEVRTIRQPQR